MPGIFFWQKLDRAIKGTQRPLEVEFQTLIKQDMKPVEFGARGLDFDEASEKGFSVTDIVGKDPMAIFNTQSSKKIDPARAMENYTNWCYAAIKSIADEVACIEWRLFRINKDGIHEEIFDHPVLDLLNGVNEFQTGPEIKYVIATHLELVGNAYLLLQDAKTVDDKPSAVFCLDPSKVKIDLDKTDYPYKIRGFYFEIENRRWYYKPEQIVHIKYPDPLNPYEGIGTVQAIAGWIDNDNAATRYNQKFFLNSATMDGVFETDFTSEAEIGSLKLSWETNHQGIENAHKTGYLPKGVHWKPTGTTQREMDFANLMDKSRDRVLAGFRVSKTILGTAESDTNRATAETADYVFSKRTIKPKMQLICSYLNEFLVPRFGDDIYISFKDPTPEDKSFKMEEMKAKTAGQPIISINEAREEYAGKGAIKGGDMVKGPMNMVDIGSPDKEGVKPAMPQPAKFVGYNPGTKIKTRAAKNAEVRKTMAQKLTDRFNAKLKEIEEIKKKNWNGLTKEEYYYIWKDFVSRVEAKQKEVKEIIQKINDGQQKEVLENLPRYFKKAVLDNLFDMEKWNGITVDLMTPVMTEIFRKEGEIAASGVGVEGVDVLSTVAGKNALKVAIELLGQSYNDTTIKLLKSKLTRALADGMNLSEAASLVNSIYEYSDISRAESVARTETFRIANEAAKQGWKDSGVVKTMKWYTAEDEMVCEFCSQMDGKIISVDDNFLDNGDSLKGSDGGIMNVDYSDVGAPPLHTNCRCFSQPEDVSID